MAKTLMITVIFSAFLLTQPTAGIAQTPAIPAVPKAPTLRIGPGDLLEVAMFDNPELSGRFRVNENGEITFPLLGPVHVEGDTAEEAATFIEKRYVEADILKPTNSHATVYISEYATQGITINGEVKTPGLYPALGIRMINDVITSAGGVLPTASSKLIITHVSAPDSPVTIEYNPEALSPVVPRVQIFPGDTIMVPRAGIVYILGNVQRPGGFTLDGRHSLTIEESMALAGGGGHGAAMNRVHLMRNVENNRKEDILISINQIYKGKAPDMALKDGDILYIPTSNVKLATQQAITSALGIGTQITIYKTAY